MTHEEFNRLLGNHEITIKIFTTTEDDGTEKTVEAFEYNGKYWLRIHRILWYVLDRTAECGKKYRMTNEAHFIKEFETKEHANNYFKKISEKKWERMA